MQTKKMTEEQLKSKKAELENEIKNINNEIYERHYRTIGVR
jgi:hypothetical protein